MTDQRTDLLRSGGVARSDQCKREWGGRETNKGPKNVCQQGVSKKCNDRQGAEFQSDEDGKSTILLQDLPSILHLIVISIGRAAYGRNGAALGTFSRIISIFWS